jgi:hypothetical protein
MSDLIQDIRTARAVLRAAEDTTTSTAIELQQCKKREKAARAELDALLDALESGEDERYPLFSPENNAKGRRKKETATP